MSAIALELQVIQPNDSAHFFYKEATVLAMNDVPKAIAYLDKADSLASLADDRELLADIAYTYGTAYYVKGDYGLALQYFLEAEELYNGLGNTLGMAKGLLGQGLIHQGIDRHLQAIDFFEKAIDTYKKAGNHPAASPAYINIAISQVDQGRWEEAKKNALLAIDLSRRTGRIDVEHIGLNKLGEIHLLEGKPETAIAFHNQVLFDKTEPSNWEKSFAYAGLAQAFKMQGDLDLAEEYGLLSVNFAKRSHSLWDLQKNTKIISEIYSDRGEIDKALEYLWLHVAYKDSLYDQEQLQELNFMSLESKEVENEKLMAEKELAEERLLFTRGLILLLVLLVAILVLLLVLFRKKREEKETFHLELEEKNKTILEQNELIQERNRKLDEANKAKDRFFSIISHDLRSPIGSIQQLLEMMKSGEFTAEEQSDLFDEMYQQVSGTSFMLNNLLTWAGTQMKGSNVNPEEVLLVEQVDNVLQAYFFSAKQKNISIFHKLQVECKVIVDKAQLSVILHNLISNAIKFTVEGKKITISYFDKGDSVALTVADGGNGMTQEKIAEILTTDTRVVSERGTGMESGTGLGLLVVKEFLRANKAQLGIESSVGKGSQFTVSFPKAH